jgi:Concanavalin A-like lectin/glucanases superfamily
MRPDSAVVLSAFAFWMRLCGGHSYGYHTYGYRGVIGAEPPNEPNLPEITGPFEVHAVIRLDDMIATDDRVVVHYSTVNPNGVADDIISIDITAPKTDIQLRLKPRNGVWCIAKAVNVVVQGEVATFSAGVKSNGTAWIAKNGVVYAETSCVIPNNVVRNSKLVGRSQANSLHRFHGAVLGLRITNLSNRKLFLEQEYQNLPGQIFDKPFTVSFWARFDKLSGRTGQKVFDFCTSQNLERISFGQEDNDTDRVEFAICRGSKCRTVDFQLSELLGTWAFWHVGVSTTGTMFIQRNGGALETNKGESLPNNTYRTRLLIGESSQNTDWVFWGAILGLRVDIDVVS